MDFGRYKKANVLILFFDKLIVYITKNYNMAKNLLFLAKIAKMENFDSIMYEYECEEEEKLSSKPLPLLYVPPKMSDEDHRIYFGRIEEVRNVHERVEEEHYR